MMIISFLFLKKRLFKAYNEKWKEIIQRKLEETMKTMIFTSFCVSFDLSLVVLYLMMFKTALFLCIKVKKSALALHEFVLFTKSMPS